MSIFPDFSVHANVVASGLNGIYCLGLPGGVIARSTISQVLSTCPGSQLVLSGYSQGAMVVRNAIARIPSDQVAKIANVVTFGDPFCGAPIGELQLFDDLAHDSYQRTRHADPLCLHRTILRPHQRVLQL